MRHQVKASEVKVGDNVWSQGYLFNITKVTFDPKGNTGNQERYVLTGNCPEAPVGYQHNMMIGVLKEDYCTIEV